VKEGERPKIQRTQQAKMAIPFFCFPFLLEAIGREIRQQKNFVNSKIFY